MSDVQTPIDVEALLNTNIADVEDLPDLVTLPAGTYVARGKKATVGTTQSKKPKLGFTFEVEEVVELENDEDTPPEPGSLTHYMFTGDQFHQRVKKAFGATMTDNGINTIAELMDQFDSLTFIINVKTRVDQDDETRVFGTLVLAMIQ